MSTASAGGENRQPKREETIELIRKSQCAVRRAGIALLVIATAIPGAAGLMAQPGGLETGQAVEKASGPPVVHAFYLVPADRQPKPIYPLQIRNALLDLQGWYQRQMGGGLTFRVSDPAVQTVSLPHTAAFYAQNPNDAIAFFKAVLTDAFQLTGGKFFDQQNLWLYYVDADPSCNQATGATSSVALLPANDLRGLNGETTINSCGGTFTQFPPSRWIGGLGHEIGIAVGLSHPPGCDQGQQSCDSHALMWLGFYDYPNTYLTSGDIGNLKQSPFFLPGACVANSTTLCSSAARFEVSGGWTTPDGQAGAAQAVQLTPDTGYFWFFNAANVEAVIKVLDACAFGNYWVFAGGLTNVNTQIRVRDTRTGDVTLYANPQGTAFQPIQDTGAFSTCGKRGAFAGDTPGGDEPLGERAAGFTALTSPPGPLASTSSVLLNNNRFKVDVTWQTKDGTTGVGTPVQLTSDTAYFWFFNSSNVEMVVKVLNACAFGDYWVFAGGLTNVRVVMTVTDTKTGKSNRYVNRQDTPFQPLQDTSAFPTCP